MTTKTKYPAIAAAYRRYRAEDAPAAETITCPGCGLAFTPEQKATATDADETKSGAAARLSRGEYARRAGDEGRGAIADPAGWDRAAVEARKHAASAGRGRVARSFAEMGRDYYASQNATTASVVSASPRGGR